MTPLEFVRARRVALRADCGRRTSSVLRALGVRTGRTARRPTTLVVGGLVGGALCGVLVARAGRAGRRALSAAARGGVALARLVAPWP